MEFQADFLLVDPGALQQSVTDGERSVLLHAGAGEAEFRALELLPVGCMERRRLLKFFCLHSRRRWLGLRDAVRYVRFRVRSGKRPLGRKRLHDAMAEALPGTGTDNHVAALLMSAVTVVAPDTLPAFLFRAERKAVDECALALIRSKWKPTAAIDWALVPPFTSADMSPVG